MNRYIVSFLLTTFVYLGGIASYIVYLKDTKPKQSAAKSSQRVKFTLISKKPPQKASKKVVKQKTQPKKVIKPKPKKIIKKKKIVKPKPKPKPKKIIKKKVIKKKKIIKPKKIIKKKKIVKLKPIVKKIIKKKVIKKPIEKIKPKKEQIFIPKPQVKKVQSKSKIGVNHEDNKQKELKKQQYFTLIKQKINDNKKYPKKAVRRGIQGIVKVQFIVSKDGKLLSINILEGKKVFYKSIKRAIRDSFPINPPKDIFIKQFNVTLKIVYKLQ